MKTNNIQHDVWRKFTPSVVISLLKPDCFDRGQNIANKGYRFNATFNIECCGTCNLVNSLVAIKKLVYEDGRYTLDEMREALANIFGYKTSIEVGSESLVDQEKRDDDDGRYDAIHADCLRPPKYGNDDPYADSILYAYEDWFCHANGDIVIQVDSDVCPSFTRGRKCKFCNHLCDVDDRGMDTCKGFSIHN